MLQVKDGSKPYKASMTCAVYLSQQTYKEKLELTAKAANNSTLGIDEI